MPLPLPLPKESWLSELMLLLTFWTTSLAKDDLNMDEGEIVVACSSRVNSRISTSGFCRWKTELSGEGLNISRDQINDTWERIEDGPFDGIPELE